jgi:predicted Zn-dependent protease
MLSRRRFLAFLATLAAAPVFSGCAVNPVTGRNQLMLVGEDDEIAMDRRQSPQQFSADFGPVQDAALNAYVTEVGLAVARQSHRPQMPYSFRVVNAPYANAYAFPGGSIAVTRGILARLESEDELAALVGHEIGHVSARHTAARLSSGTVLSVVLGGAAAALGAAKPGLQDVAGDVAGLGAGILLAKYSRDDEREADSLGMAYMVAAGYSPQGMVDLMAMLRGLSTREPGLVEILFATHPMSDERFTQAQSLARQRYAAALSRPRRRERFAAATARLRAQLPALERLEAAQRALGNKQPAQARALCQQALSFLPDDYAALVLLARAELAADAPQAAVQTAQRARAVYPSEAQGILVHGLAAVRLRRFAEAVHDFTQALQLLPADPTSLFWRGYALEAMGDRQAAAQDYYRYLQQGPSGPQAKYALRRLKEWRYVR